MGACQALAPLLARRAQRGWPRLRGGSRFRSPCLGPAQASSTSARSPAPAGLAEPSAFGDCSLGGASLGAASNFSLKLGPAPQPPARWGPTGSDAGHWGKQRPWRALVPHRSSPRRRHSAPQASPASRALHRCHRAGCMTLGSITGRSRGEAATQGCIHGPAHPHLPEPPLGWGPRPGPCGPRPPRPPAPRPPRPPRASMRRGAACDSWAALSSTRVVDGDCRAPTGGGMGKAQRPRRRCCCRLMLPRTGPAALRHGLRPTAAQQGYVEVERRAVAPAARAPRRQGKQRRQPLEAWPSSPAYPMPASHRMAAATFAKQRGV